MSRQNSDLGRHGIKAFILVMVLMVIGWAPCLLIYFVPHIAQMWSPWRNKSLEVTVAAPLHLFAQDEIDVEALVAWLENSVSVTLPRAYYQAMRYEAKSEDLPTMRGEYWFTFVQPIPWLLDRAVLLAEVRFDTETGLVEISYWDETGRYRVETRGQIPDSAWINEVISMADEQLLDSGSTGCIVELYHFIDEWWVGCYPDQIGCKCFCNLEIVDGELHDLSEDPCWYTPKQDTGDSSADSPVP